MPLRARPGVDAVEQQPHLAEMIFSHVLEAGTGPSQEHAHAHVRDDVVLTERIERHGLLERFVWKEHADVSAGSHLSFGRLRKNGMCEADGEQREETDLM